MSNGHVRIRPMSEPTLLNDGDRIERESWSYIRDDFPHYEEFWQKHVYPLRRTDSIHFRQGIDEDFEYMAMAHYSTYANLREAHDRLSVASQNFQLPDALYWHLFRTAELANKVVERFSKIYLACLGRPCKAGNFDTLLERFRQYRNLIHQQIPAVLTDAEGAVYIPRPECLGNYPKWTDVLYRCNRSDFVPVLEQLHSDFRALCSGLEDIWKVMCREADALQQSSEYRRRIRLGVGPVATLSMPSTASGAIALSSCTMPTCTVVSRAASSRSKH
jgi:hypothetical protein